MPRIMVVEADEAFAGQIKTTLESQGATVFVLVDGEATVNVATELVPELILLRVELPGVNGYSICNKLKKHPTLRGVPLVMMSSAGSPEVFAKHRRLKAHADEYLLAPFPMTTLVDAIAPFAVLGQEAVASGASQAMDFRDDDDEIIIEAGDEDEGEIEIDEGDIEIDEADILIDDLDEDSPIQGASTDADFDEATRISLSAGDAIAAMDMKGGLDSIDQEIDRATDEAFAALGFDEGVEGGADVESAPADPQMREVGAEVAAVSPAPLAEVLTPPA
ncbi:MAG: response regulator, partial [Deltaproteobacteria bacterium]|nr:response regulator [Deltaproteobacteria bacterium]